MAVENKVTMWLLGCSVGLLSINCPRFNAPKSMRSHYLDIGIYKNTYRFFCLFYCPPEESHLQKTTQLSSTNHII